MASRVPVNPSRDFSFRLVFVAFFSGFETSRNSGHAPFLSRGDPVWVADLRVVETRGLEPLTLWMQTRCSPTELRPQRSLVLKTRGGPALARTGDLSLIRTAL